MIWMEAYKTGPHPSTNHLLPLRLTSSMSRRSASRAATSCSLCEARKFFCFEPHDASSFTQHRTKVRRLRDTSSLASMASLAMVSWQWHEASCKSLEGEGSTSIVFYSLEERFLTVGPFYRSRLDRTGNSPPQGAILK